MVAVTHVVISRKYTDIYTFLYFDICTYTHIFLYLYICLYVFIYIYWNNVLQNQKSVSSVHLKQESGSSLKGVR